MTYPDGPGPYPQPGRAPGAPPPVQPSKAPRGNTWARLGVAATILAAAIGGGIIGSLLTNRADSTTADTSATTAADGAPTPEYVHSQDIKLCTEYALITVARPQPGPQTICCLPWQRYERRWRPTQRRVRTCERHSTMSSTPTSPRCPTWKIGAKRGSLTHRSTTRRRFRQPMAARGRSADSSKRGEWWR